MPVRRTAKSPGTADAATPSEEAIRQRAYEIYRTRGAAPGHAQDDWMQAVQELTAKPPAAKPKKRRLNA